MKTYFLYILFFVVFIREIPAGTFLEYPYKFEYLRTEGRYSVHEVEFFKNNEKAYITFEVGETKSTIRIQGSDWSLYEAINFPFGTKFSRTNETFIYDFNGDSREELLYFLTAANKLEIYILEFETGVVKNNLLVSIPIGKEFYTGRIWYALSDDKTNLFISYSSDFPEQSSSRGIISYNLSLRRVNWFYPTAYHVNSMIFHEGKLYFSTNGVYNGLIYKNGSFYLKSKKTKGEYLKGVSADNFISVGFNRIIDAGFSTDSISVLGILNQDGVLENEIELGGPFTWSNIRGLNSEILLFIGKRTEKYNSFEFLKLVNTSVNISFEEAMPEFPVIHSFIVNPLGNFITLDDKKVIEFDNNLNIKNQVQHNELLYLIEKNISVNGRLHFYSVNRYLYNNEFEVIAEMPEGVELKYLSAPDEFALEKKGQLIFYKLIKVPLYNRITSSGYLLILLAVTLISIIFLLNILQYRSKVAKQKKNIDNLTAELIESEKLALLGTISSSIAHELNSPIGAIINSVQRLKHLEKESDIYIRSISLIENAAARCKTIVEKFLENSSKNDKPEIIALNTAVDDWSVLYGYQLEIHGIKVHKNIDESFVVKIPSSELNQILTNLLLNAKDALMNKEQPEKTIIIEAYYSDNYAFINFEDNGPGFAEQILLKGIVPFNSTKEKGKGTGLGLWISKKIVEKWGGNLYFNNNVNGALVTIKLPKP